MSTYVISDIHGNYERWTDIKNRIGFSDDDKMIIVGDVVDRGSCGIRIIREIMKSDNMILLLGNHELMMIENILSSGDPDIPNSERKSMFDNWVCDNGGYDTFVAFNNLDDDEAFDMLDFLRSCHIKGKTTVNDKTFSLVHGFTTVSDDDYFGNLWNRPADIHYKNHLDDDSTLIIGHTPVPNLLPQDDKRFIEGALHGFKILHADNYINIDCGCGHNFPGARLACLRLDDMEEFYSSI